MLRPTAGRIVQGFHAQKGKTLWKIWEEPLMRNSGKEQNIAVPVESSENLPGRAVIAQLPPFERRDWDRALGSDKILATKELYAAVDTSSVGNIERRKRTNTSTLEENVTLRWRLSCSFSRCLAYKKLQAEDCIRFLSECMECFGNALTKDAWMDYFNNTTMWKVVEMIHLLAPNTQGQTPEKD
nr:hypothetical protein Iba_chr14cCG12020 [Ipomoea batatas]